jgi:cell fate (sporulation/competence/biofilm development) regulator YlbF (YheA/YmcA/DUF963 family)
MSGSVNPYDKAHELARAIKESDTFRRYIEAKYQVEQIPEYKEQIYQLREKQMEINRAQVLGQDPAPALIQGLTLEFAQLSQKKEIADFFAAEARFIEMFNDVQEIIQKSIKEDFGD